MRGQRQRQWSHDLTTGSSVEILDPRHLGQSRVPRERCTVTVLGRAGISVYEHPYRVFWWVAEGKTWQRWVQDADKATLGSTPPDAA